MITHNEKICQIALHQIKGLGPRAYRLIMEEFDQVSDIYSLDESTLKEFISSEKIRAAILEKQFFDQAEKEYEYCSDNNIDILFFKDSKYPQRLNFYESSPCILYYKGSADLNSNRIVSIVGTREPSEYGKVQCEKIVQELKAHQCLIVSGLAYGIDITAHNAALKQSLDTIGVMAHGHQHLYPEQHRSTANRMISQGGLLTEFLHHTEAIREAFPMRNRIVAGMCDAIIVVQSATKGGSLITAEFGNEYGKDVFAVPGRPDDESSKGCNLLIKSHKASMYESVKDLEYILRWDKKKVAVQTSLFQDLSEDEQSILGFIKHKGEAHIDEIHKFMKKPSGSLSALILNLELIGLLKSIPGKRYICI